EPLPRLHPIPHLDEADVSEALRQTCDQPLDRRAPGARHLRCLAPVDADHRDRARRPHEAHVSTGRESARSRCGEHPPNAIAARAPAPEVRRAEARLVALGEVSERSKERDWKSRTW